MRIAATISRYLLAIMLVFFSCLWFSGEFGFYKMAPPPGWPAKARAFSDALYATGYMTPMLKLVELFVGLSLLFNRFVRLALVVLAPVSVNILLYHAFLDPSIVTGGAGYLLFGLHVILLYSHRERYRTLLTMRSEG